MVQNNQVIIKEKESGILWWYDVDPEDWDFVQKRAERDEKGNYVLSAPAIASLKRWDIERVVEGIDDKVKKMNVPNFIQPSDSKETFDLASIFDCSNEDLQKMLSIYGGYKAYLETQLSHIEARRSILEASFEEGLAKMFYILSQENGGRKTKEILRGESLTKSPLLKKTKQDLIEVEGLFIRVKGIRDAYRVAFETVSRVVTLRTNAKGEM